MLEILFSISRCHRKLCILDAFDLACSDAHLSSTVVSATPTTTLR